jgi:uncharacterized protein YdaU (DUF1376 family)
MPLYIGDYLRDTRRLTTLEHGAYILLIMEYWSHGPLDDDQALLQAVTGMSEPEWVASEPKIRRFFVIKDGKWKHKRIDRELQISENKYEKRAASGRKGGLSKASNARAMLEQCSTNHNHNQNLSIPYEDSQNEPLSVSSKPTSAKKSNKRISYPPDFERFWKAYPTDANMAKSEAFTEWKKLDADDHHAAERSLTGFRAYCRSRPDYRPVHANRYLKYRRFEGHLELAEKLNKSVKVYLKPGMPQWEVWSEYTKRTTGKSLLVDARGGWYFPSEYPEERYAADVVH